MQKVRNNIHKARKHTQKASRDIRKLRERRRMDYYDRPLNPETISAMEETEQIIASWLKFHKEHDISRIKEE